MPSDSSFAVLGDLIAAIPAMLGFTPERSLVVIALKQSSEGQHEVDVVMRMDLPTRGKSTASRLTHRIAEACARADIVAALAVVVDDRLVRASEGSAAPGKHRLLLTALERSLAECGTELIGGWAVADIGAGAPWWNLRRSGDRGTQGDPASSFAAAERVLASMPIHGRREDLAAVVAVDGALRDQVAAVVPEAVADAQRRLTRDLCIGNPEASTRAALWRVMHVVKTPDPAAVTPRGLADVAVALTDLAVRDCLFGVVDGVYADAAERLWTVATRALPDPYRAEAAALLGFHAYVRGDGPLAGIAFEEALASDPDHRIAGLLSYALGMAMRPDNLHKLAEHGAIAAAALRIDIGVAQPDPAAGVTQ
ncbi:DUF4192 domain-containing protein [Nocardia sp. NPDC004722]